MGTQERGRRAPARTLYWSVSDGLDAMRIHDGAARDIVHGFVEQVLTSAEYRTALRLDIAESLLGTTSLAELLTIGHLRLWTTPSMQYLALGARLVTEVAHPVDGYQVIARAYRSRLVVDSILCQHPTHLIKGSTIAYPNSVTTQRGAPRRGMPTPAVCPTCFQTLPATGVCDTCS